MPEQTAPEPTTATEAVVEETKKSFITKNRLIAAAGTVAAVLVGVTIASCLKKDDEEPSTTYNETVTSEPDAPSES